MRTHQSLERHIHTLTLTPSQSKSPKSYYAPNGAATKKKDVFMETVDRARSPIRVRFLFMHFEPN